MPDAPRQAPVLITGAARGIGAAAARAFARAGHPVVLLGRNAGALDRLAGEIGQSGGRAARVLADVADAPAVGKAVQQAVAAFGGLGVVVNNAGVVEPMAKIVDADPAQWAEHIRTNLIGAFNVLHYAVPHLPAGGTVINVSSGASLMAVVGWSGYCSSKSGINSLSAILAAEESARGLRVFNFMPGLVNTDMQDQIRANPINATGSVDRNAARPVEEPAQVMLWLLTAAANDLAGTVVSGRDPAFRRRAGLPG